MREVEVKVLEIDKKELEKTLGKLKAKKEYSGPVESTYFDFKEGTLKASGCTLRLRKQGKKVTLTFKSKLKSTSMKVMEEEEIALPSFKEAEKVLCSVGMEKLIHVKKRRTSYTLGNVKVEIDKYKGIPPFAEIEASSEKDVWTTLKKLGLEKKETVKWNFWQVLDYYKKK